MKSDTRVTILVIGGGHHARRVYLPNLLKLEGEEVALAGVVDLATETAAISEFLKSKGSKAEVISVPVFPRNTLTLPGEVATTLSDFVRAHKVRGVIISTEPQVHFAYARWAISINLNILMDKPITLRANLVSSEESAIGLIQDHQILCEEFKKAQRHRPSVFMINVQRRFEPTFKRVLDLIAQARDRFNIPVTSIQCSHADGTWVFPTEVLTQTMHPYNTGYGKCGHSGYHFFDFAWQLYRAGWVESKAPEACEVISSFITPDSTLSQFSIEDYKTLFNGDIDLSLTDQVALEQNLQTCGETDAFVLIKFLRNKKSICNVGINLLHNSFSLRAWNKPRADLYKGNGRVKHQYFAIQQGPFQSIQIHNYQATDEHDHVSGNDFNLGGRDHFEVNVFRNAQLFGLPKAQVLTQFSSADTFVEGDASKLIHERVKEKVLNDFIEAIRQGKGDAEVDSSITSHEIPVKLMAYSYLSHVLQQKGKSIPARFPLSLEDSYERF